MKLKLNDQGFAVVLDGKPVYVHDDGKEVAFDAASAVSKIAALNAEAKSHREGKEAAEAKAKAFEGIEDAEAARRALETLRNIDEGKLMAAGKVEEIKAAAQKAAQEQVAAASKSHAEELARTKSALEKLQGDLYAEKIGGGFSRSKLLTDPNHPVKLAIPADLVQARFGQAFKVEDGKIVAYDNAGNKIFSRVRPGEIADFDEALETLVDQYPYKEQILQGTRASGGGAQGGGSGGGPKGGDFGGSRADRIQAINSQFPDLARAS
jgi:hypothetical protein